MSHKICISREDAEHIADCLDALEAHRHRYHPQYMNPLTAQVLQRLNALIRASHQGEIDLQEGLP